jgi:hypothetical protein
LSNLPFRNRIPQGLDNMILPNQVVKRLTPIFAKKRLVTHNSILSFTSNPFIPHQISPQSKIQKAKCREFRVTQSFDLPLLPSGPDGVHQIPAAQLPAAESKPCRQKALSFSDQRLAY